MDAERMPGRELDAEIAREVMGRVPCKGWRYQHADELINDSSCGHTIGTCYPEGNPLPYSTSIEAAWAVVEKMLAGPLAVDIQCKGRDQEYAGTYEVSVREGIFTVGHAVGGTAPLAICRAALKVHPCITATSSMWPPQLER